MLGRSPGPQSGEELLARVGGLAECAHDGHTMGIPPLYPWANRLADFDYRINDRTVRIPHDPELIQLENHGLPIHGVIGGRPAWELVPTRAPERNTLSARLTWDASAPDLFDVFPFAHELLYEARLTHGCLELALTIHATGSDGVPLAFGFHPYICPPGASRRHWQVELPAMRRLTVDANQIPIGPDQTLPAQRLQLGEHEFDDAFDRVAEPSRFAVTAAGPSVEVEFLDCYPCAQVFAPSNIACICFEPMAAPPNALRSGSGLRILRPGECAHVRFSIQVQDTPLPEGSTFAG